MEVFMTEKEKAAKGLLYYSADKLLSEERDICKQLCYEYNNLPPLEKEKRHLIMNKILGKTKNSFYIEQPFLCDYGYNIEIGENFYAKP